MVHKAGPETGSFMYFLIDTRGMNKKVLKVYYNFSSLIRYNGSNQP